MTYTHQDAYETLHLRWTEASRRGGVVPSPCLSICHMQLATGECVGCHRTLEEIAQWGDLDEAQKRLIWPRLLERARAAAERSGHSKG